MEVKLSDLGQIFTIKFNNGIEVISKITKIEQDALFLENPRQIVQVQQHGQIGISLVPIAISTDPNISEVVVSVHSLMFFPVLTSDEFAKNYIQATTGIAIPQTSIITG